MINSAFNIECGSLLRKALHGMAAENKKCLLFVRRNTLCCFPCHSHRALSIQLFSLWVCQDPAVIPGNEWVEIKWFLCGSCPSFPSLYYPTPWLNLWDAYIEISGKFLRAEIPLTAVSFSSVPEASTRSCTRRQSLKSRWSHAFLVLAMVVPQRHTGNISYGIILNSAKFINIQWPFSQSCLHTQ